MTSKQTIWMHAHSIQMQNASHLQVTHHGHYTHIEASELDEKYWFHCSIPTPGPLMALDEAYLRHVTGDSNYQRVYISAVRLYDGEEIIVRHDDLKLRAKNWSVSSFAVDSSKPPSCSALWTGYVDLYLL